MTQDQCISVTDLRTKTKQCLSGLNEEPKYIFVNNKPVAVLLNIEDYETLAFKPELKELEEDKVTDGLILSAKAAKRTKKEDLINI